MSNIDELRRDLNLLVALDALLAERSVTRAAKRLGVTQSAMSHRLRRLRDLLDDELLVRDKRSMVLTARAESMVGPLRQAMEAVTVALRAGAEFDPMTSTRRFTIAGSDYGEFAALPTILPRLLGEAPLVRIDLRPPGPRMLDDLSQGRVDCYIGPMFRAPASSTLMRRRILTEGFVLVLGHAHSLADQPIDLPTYLSLRHLQIAPGGRAGGVIDDALAQLGHERDVAVRTAYFVTAPFLVAATELAWTAPRLLVEAASRYVDLAVCDLPFDSPTIDTFVYWHPRFNADPGHLWLREQIVRMVGEA